MIDLKDPGLIVVAVIFALFYLRLAMLRGKKKRLDREATLKRMRTGKKSAVPQKDPNETWFRIASWWLVGLALVLMCVGVAMKTSTWFPVAITPYWWVPVGLGGITFTFSITV